MLCTKIVLNVRNNFCTHVLPSTVWAWNFFLYWTCNSMNNLSSYCGLVDAKIRASDKDLPVMEIPITCRKFYLRSMHVWRQTFFGVFFTYLKVHNLIRLFTNHKITPYIKCIATHNNIYTVQSSGVKLTRLKLKVGWNWPERHPLIFCIDQIVPGFVIYWAAKQQR
jgi:hypothetical protein